MLPKPVVFVWYLSHVFVLSCTFSLLVVLNRVIQRVNSSKIITISFSVHSRIVSEPFKGIVVSPNTTLILWQNLFVLFSFFVKYEWKKGSTTKRHDWEEKNSNNNNRATERCKYDLHTEQEKYDSYRAKKYDFHREQKSTTSLSCTLFWH